MSSDSSSEPRWWAQLAAQPPQRPGGARELSQSTFDAVVVGSGVAGLTASIVAASRGLSVALLEAGERGGGTTFKSGGGYWIPNNSLMRARGKNDDREAALRYMASLSFPAEYEPDAPMLGLAGPDYQLLSTYFARASEAVDELGRIGALRTREFQSFSGEYEGMVSYHSELVEEFGRHLVPAAPDGSQELGSGLVIQLTEAAKRLGVEYVVSHRVTSVLSDSDGAVTGVVAQTPAGPVEVEARRGVIFGSGGFTHDIELIERHFAGPIYGGCAVSTNRGDFVRIGSELGAELGNMSHGWLAQSIFEATLQQREREDMVFMPSGDSMVFVDARGRRVVNEKQIYQERTKIHFVRDADGSFPNRLLFMIYDRFVAEDPRPWSNPWPAGATEEPYVITGATLGELAKRIAERLASLRERTGDFALEPEFAQELERTVERFNELAAKGVDEDFGRGEHPHELDWNRAAREGNALNPTMYPFSSNGPYHAVIIGGGTLDTNGGPRINERGEVLRPDRTPIPRLYGAGNCIASPTARAYWSGGSTIGPAMTFAYIAALELAQQPARVAVSPEVS